jgi:hypothetical protein
MIFQVYKTAVVHLVGFQVLWTPEGKGPLKRTCCKLEDNIKTDLE